MAAVRNGGRSKRNVSSPFFSVQRLVLWAAALALLVLVIYPVTWLVGSGFGAPTGFTLQHIFEIFQRSDLREALWNTLFIATAVGLLSVIIGVPLAWLVARTDVPYPTAIELMAYLSFIFPSFLSAIAYVLLLGPGAGWLNKIIMAILGINSAPFDIFSISGIVFVTTLHVYPFVFLLSVNSLRSLNPSLEYAATIHGASRFTVNRKIVLPLVAPGILAGALLAFVDSIALFGIQAILGIPKGVHTLPTKIYAFFGYPPRFELASALSLVLVGIAVLALYFQRRYLGRRSYVTVAGKGARIEPTRLGKWRVPAFTACVAFFSLALFLPTVVLVGVSFMRSVAIGFTGANLTLENYRELLFDPSLRQAIFNSLWLAAAAACFGVVIGSLIAYMDLRTNYRGRKFLDYLSLVPLGLPGIVLAVALVLAWIRPPLVLYGTAWILLIAYVTRFIPFTVRTANASLRQVHEVLERAARISGATWLRTMRSITLPLIKSGLLVGWILVFIQAMRELSASILLYSRGNQTMAVAIYNLYDEGFFPTTCALATLTLIVTLAAVWVVRIITARQVIST